MTVTLDDVEECVYALESGKDYAFVLEGEHLRPYFNSDDDVEDMIIVLTSEWYELTYCSNDWDNEVLMNELNDFAIRMDKLSNEFISTKFTVMWR